MYTFVIIISNTYAKQCFEVRLIYKLNDIKFSKEQEKS